MGTRGAIGFRVDGVDKIVYNHFDSYPEGLGADLIAQLCGKKDWGKVKEAVRKITFIDPDVPPTPEQIEKFAPYTDLSVGNQSPDDWYCLLRRAQGTIEPYLTGDIDVMSDAHGFLLDSLFCEYAYIINLDDMTLEFYRGFNEEAGGAGRYACQKEPPRKRHDGTVYESSYYGVVLKEAMPLADLPKTKRCKTFVNKTLKRWNELCRRPGDDE